LLRTITDGVNEPEALAVDPAGNLYVANRETKNITAYAPGSTTVSFTIANVPKVRAMQFDPAGELNVAGSDDVTVYAAGTGQLLRSIKNKLHHPYRLAFDPAGDLFVLSFDVKPRKTDIVEFAPGATKATRYFGVSQYANCLVVGPDGYLYVGNDTTVLVIDPATGATVRTISDGVYDSLTVAFDSVGNFYLSNNGAGNGIISVYAPGATAPMYEIKQDDAYSFALLFDAKNNLYVASQYGGQSNYGMVAEFAPGQTSPKRIIEDGMMYPNAAAFGPK
jgi:serine/threonine protein kinase, bacterial